MGEEQVQKRSLKGFLHGPNVPQELIQTVQDIPEIPNEVKPLELSQDKELVLETKEDDISKEETEVEVIPKPKVKTPIQELVEQHYAKPMLIEHKEIVEDKIFEPSPAEDEIKSSSAEGTAELVEAIHQSDTRPTNQGVVSGSLSYVLEQVFRQGKMKSDPITTNSQSEGLVRGGLSHFFRQ